MVWVRSSRGPILSIIATLFYITDNVYYVDVYYITAYVFQVKYIKIKKYKNGQGNWLLYTKKITIFVVGWPSRIYYFKQIYDIDLNVLFQR